MITENMMDMVALHEPDGTYIYVSPSVKKILGYTPDELRGTSPYELIHPDDINHIKTTSHERAKKGQEIFSAEYRIKRKDGKYLWFDTNTMPIKNEDEDIVQFQTVSRDITKNKEHREKLLALNQELEELNTQKDKLISVISHDLRNPFQNFIGLFDLVLKDYENISKEEIHEMLIELKKSSDSAFSLLQDILLWSRNEFGAIDISIKCINCKKSVDGVISYLSYFARKKNISVNNEIDPDFECNTDEHIFRTIMRNLISNAIKFSPEGSSVEVRALKMEDYTYFAVKDHGIGIDSDKIEKILNVNSVHSTPGTDGEKGVGLGLSLCKDFIEKMGGELKIKSRGQNGSTFTFSLPVC